MAEIPPPNSPAYREAAETIRANDGSRAGDPPPMDEVVSLYVCPTEGCGSYYGSSSMGDLSTQARRSRGGTPTGLRTECPRCGAEREERYARLIPKAEVEAARRAAKRTARS